MDERVYELESSQASETKTDDSDDDDPQSPPSGGSLGELAPVGGMAASSDELGPELKTHRSLLSAA